MLAQISRRCEPAGYLRGMQLAAGIIASTDGARACCFEPRSIQERQHGTAKHRCQEPWLRQGRQEPRLRVAGADGVRDAGVWQRNLTFLGHGDGDGEAEFTCPSCSEKLLLNLDEPPCRVDSFADELLCAGGVTPLEPPRKTHESRVLRLAREAGRAIVAEKLAVLLAARSARDFAHLSASRAHDLTRVLGVL